MYDMDMALVDLDHARTEMQRLQAQTAATAAAPYDSQAAAGAATPLSPAADGSSVHMLQSAFDAVTTSYTYPSPCCSAAPCTDPRPHQHHPHIHKPAPLSSLTAAPPLLRHDPSLLLPGRDPELGFEAGELAHAARAFGEQVLDTVGGEGCPAGIWVRAWRIRRMSTEGGEHWLAQLSWAESAAVKFGCGHMQIISHSYCTGACGVQHLPVPAPGRPAPCATPPSPALAPGA